MKKLYIDKSDLAEGTTVYIDGTEIIYTGVTMCIMPVDEKDADYQGFADEYDIRFIFDDNIPKVDFYTVPHVDIFATDSHGGFIGTIGQTTDLQSDAQIWKMWRI